MDMLLRHLAACNNARLPGERLAFCIGTDLVGWVKPALADALADFAGISRTGDAVILAADAAADLPTIAHALAQRRLLRWRDEAFDVRSVPDGPVLSQIDRGALPVFGVQAQGVHLDGLVRRRDGLHLWIARRSASKALDPGKLDHIVAGGIPAGLGPAETLLKEAAEEAAMPEELARRAVFTGTLAYAMERPEGLRRDLLHCYEVELPADFTPYAVDGEVEAFELWPLARVLDATCTGDFFKFNVNAVLAALFLRHGLITGDAAQRVRAALPGFGPEAR